MIKSSKTQVFILAWCTFLLVHTAVAMTDPVQIANPYLAPVTTYLLQAKTQKGTQKQQSLLSAAGCLIYEGQWQQGLAILAQTHDLTLTQLDEKNVLLAQVDLMRDKPDEAFRQLNKINEAHSFSLYHQIQYHELLAQVHRLKNRPMESISERLLLEHLLTDEKAYANNQKTLWFTLATIPQEELELYAQKTTPGSELQGWINLVMISQVHRKNLRSLFLALEQWQAQFRSHPANRLLPSPLESIANRMPGLPQRIALLLPLTGELSGPGEAIRDGFMAAYEANQSDSTIKFYDTNQKDIVATYQQAIQEGADFVIGPLKKQDVTTIAAIQHPVPTLLLNDADLALKTNSYSFGMSPRLEAMEVAKKARSKGYRNALVIAPKTDWGNSIRQAFTRQWQKQGGQVAGTYSYADNEDIHKTMRDFLHINQSQARENRIKQILGHSIESSITRRQDFDVVFLLAYPSKARQIIPLLKYYYAGDVPVYATSTVYSGNANALKDKDLDGLIFCDIPWVFSHQMSVKNWPEQWNSYNRLYALGMDSQALTTQLNQLMVFPSEKSQATGFLYLKSNQKVARVFEWGQFKQGLAHSLGEV